MHPSTQPSTQEASIGDPSAAPIGSQKHVYTSTPFSKRVSYSEIPTPLPSFLVTKPPTVATDSACITVSMETTISQADWTKEDVIVAMKEAVSESFQVPVNTVFVNYTDESCRSSVVFNPDGDSINRRRTLSMKSLFLPSFMNSALNLQSPFTALANDVSRRLQFSILIPIPGRY
jgi:hypothetical protein